MPTLGNGWERVTKRLPSWHFSLTNCFKSLCDHFEVDNLHGFGCQDLEGAISAGGSLLEYCEKM